MAVSGREEGGTEQELVTLCRQKLSLGKLGHVWPSGLRRVSGQWARTLSFAMYPFNSPPPFSHFPVHHHSVRSGRNLSWRRFESCHMQLHPPFLPLQSFKLLYDPVCQNSCCYHSYFCSSSLFFLCICYLHRTLFECVGSNELERSCFLKAQL